jgi:putative drug exporter of the RND superfamily
VAARYPGLRIAEAGDASYGRAVSSLLDNGFRRAESTSVPITLVLLLGVFGALMAAGIPLPLAITSVVTALSLLTIISHWLPVGSSTSEVVLIIGMAVGVDYSLFYLRRERVVFAFVIGLAFVLLLVAFRSVAIPLVSIGLNLLSVGPPTG